MSSYMSHLAGLVGSGLRTSSVFKKVHLNACARVLNNHFRMRLTGDQIDNHVRTWKRKYAKICNLIRLSGALWEEDTCTIRLDHEPYTGHIKDHKADAEYLNKSIEHYGEMFTIFSNSLTTGKFVKGSNKPLGTQVNENEDEYDEVYVSAAAATPVHEDNCATSSVSEPKKVKTSHNEEEELIAIFEGVGEILAEAIIKSVTGTSDVPPDLYALWIDGALVLVTMY